MAMKTIIPSHLTDDALAAEVARLAARHRDTTAQLVAHLAEFDARRLYLGAGFSSLFTYCREILHLSESEAYNRIEAARAARRFPVILDRLADGSLNLTSVRLLARHLSDGNHVEMLAAARGKSKQDVEELVVRYFPRPEVPSSVRKLPEPRTPIQVSSEPAAMATVPARPTGGSSAEPAAAAIGQEAPATVPAPRHTVVAPLAPDRYEVRFTASAQTRDKLRLAQDLLRHAVPSGDLGEIFDRALTSLLEDLARKKFAATHRPRPVKKTAAGSRHIPARVRRAVWLRDGGRCAFVAESGRRCCARAFIEFHHVDPYAVGGAATEDNLQLRCEGHNGHEADLFYGAAKREEWLVREANAPYGVRRRELVPERVRQAVGAPS
jgi:5-methylcytosine-specific restriction endonuclease McrA